MIFILLESSFTIDGYGGQLTFLRQVFLTLLSKGTSYAMQGDEEKAKQAGCTGYIGKPINTRNFAKYVNHYLRSAIDTGVH